MLQTGLSNTRGATENLSPSEDVDPKMILRDPDPVAKLHFESPKYAMAVVEKVDQNFVFPIEREPAGQLYRDPDQQETYNRF